jgi:hypothetical protein
MSLPWTTTKRELNKETKIYQYVRDKMAIAARPVISFLNRKYPSDLDEEPIEREISKATTSVSLGELASRTPTVFRPPTPVKIPVKTTKKIQYDAEISDLEKIRKHLRKPYMAFSEIGRYTFDFFLRQEGLK